MFQPRTPDKLWSEASSITLLRLIGCLCLFTLAALWKDPTLNYIGLGLHWFGDVLDGFWARKFRQETVTGAGFDIIADRIDTLFFYTNFLIFNPTLYLPIMLYLVNFAFIDLYLSFQFLKYDIISINYFYKVDQTVHKLNFSTIGKFCNSTIVTGILIFLPQLWHVAAVWALGLIGIKGYSILRLQTREPDRV
jgi:CDP-diacylglycerol--glycerol-3-phosphate 3-phosphatidyltransferase